MSQLYFPDIFCEDQKHTFLKKKARSCIVKSPGAWAFRKRSNIVKLKKNE